MADVQEYAARLAQTIGPRPAGTEEEQQASFVIEEVLQKEASLKVQSEEFNCNPNYELPRIICCIVSLVLVILSMFLPLVLIPALIICLITAALFVLESLGLSPLARTSKRGVSQNVIGKYIPLNTGDQGPVARRRKVVLVARYDTGKVSRELSGPLFGALNIIHWIELVAMVLIPVALLIRILADAEGGVLIFVNVLAGIGAVGAALPVLAFILHQTAPFNDGANCNAAGVAVMLDVAKRVGLGLYDQDGGEEATIHGEAAAREKGLLPEGADVEYAVPTIDEVSAPTVAGAGAEPSATSAMEPMDLSAEIAAAKAARAARAEGAVEQPAAATPAPVAADAAQAAAAVHPDAMPQMVPEAPAVATAAPAVAASAPMPAAAAPQSDVPDWYKRAREKANRSATDSVPVQRSRFAEAMDAANAAREAEAARLAEEQKGQVSEVEKRLAAMRASIMGEAVPQQETHAPSGIGGFLASTTEAPDYATASASLDDLNTAATTETKQAGDVADRIMSHSAPAAQAKAPAPAEEAAKEDAAPAAKQEHRPRRSIALPSLTGAIQAVSEKQLAEADDADQEQSEPVLNEVERRHERQAALSASIPSLDSSPAPRRSASRAAVEEDESISVSQAGSFTVGGATGAFDPVGDELLADVDPDDVYIDDADDSDYDDGFTEAGAMAGAAGYVNMPSSRKSRVLDKFRRRKKEEEPSFSEAFGLEKDFDARRVGKKRGGWESFQNQSADFDDDWGEDDDWNGGAFSKERLGAALSRVKPGSSEGGERRSRNRDAESEDVPRTRFAGTSMDESGQGAGGAHRNLHPFADIPLHGLAEEREAVQEFHSGPINMEIWFVALGADLADNAGMKALIADHGAELKGAMVIDLDGLGAGELSLIEQEGMFRPVKMSSRMKRYVRKASVSLGLSVGKGTMLWRNSAASVAARQGYQTLHLAGLAGGKPAYMGQADDVMDNISEDIMQDNADFVMELIRAI